MLKERWKRFKKSDLVRNVACRLIAAYIRLVWATGRWETVNGSLPEDLRRAQKPFIMAFWHGRLLMMPALWPTTSRMHVLISMHRDGEIIARAVGSFGLGTVRGSAAKPGSTRDKGGAAALRNMLKLLKANEYVAITPDGPRGPRMRATDGVLTVARMSGAPILPCTVSARRSILLGSWDRFMIPLPFTRGVVAWGEPIEVPRDADAEAMADIRARVEAALTAVMQQADAAMGVERIEPAPAGATA